MLAVIHRKSSTVITKAIKITDTIVIGTNGMEHCNEHCMEKYFPLY
jgi:hypothetical protein